MASVIECPKCSKKAVVERRADLYECLSCDFKRDLSTPSAKPGVDFPWVFMLALMITLLIMGLMPNNNSSYRHPRPAPFVPEYAQ